MSEGDRTEIHCPGIKERVMRKIKERHLKITRRWVFLAKKLNLESGLILSFLLGALLVSLTLYFFEETKLSRFLSLGWPGFKVFFLSLPYGYIILFGAAVLAAIYLAEKLNLPCQINTACHIIALYFLAAVIVLGIVFVFLGINKIIRGWHNEIVRDRAVYGRIKEITEEGVLLEDRDGHLIKIIMGKNLPSTEKELKYEEGRFLRAVGARDRDDDSFFHAQRVRCCDDD